MSYVITLDTLQDVFSHFGLNGIEAIHDDKNTSVKVRELIEQHWEVDDNDATCEINGDLKAFLDEHAGNTKGLSQDKKDAAYEQGKQETKDSLESGGEDVTTGENGRTAMAGAAAATSVATGVAAAIAATAGKTANMAARARTCGWIGVACTALLGTLDAMVSANKPHKKEDEDLTNEQAEGLPAAQACIQETIDEMEEALDETEELAARAEDLTESANEKMEKDVNENYLEDLDRHETLGEWIKAGTATEDEKKEYEEFGDKREEYVDQNDDITSDTNDEVGDIHDEMDAKIEVFDNGAENLERVRAHADVVANFDTATKDGARQDKNSFKMASVAAGVNGLGLGVAAAKAAAKWAWWETAIFGAAAVVSGLEVSRFSKHASSQAAIQSNAEAAIQMREQTQAMQGAASEQYSSDIDEYAESMAFVEDDLVLEVPELEAPEEDGNEEGSEEGAENAYAGLGSGGSSEGSAGAGGSSEGGSGGDDGSTRGAGSNAQTTNETNNTATSEPSDDEKNGTKVKRKGNAK